MFSSYIVHMNIWGEEHWWPTHGESSTTEHGSRTRAAGSIIPGNRNSGYQAEKLRLHLKLPLTPLCLQGQ